MQKPNFPKKPLNHPDHVTALIKEGKEAMMKRQMKMMMKTIKENIEGGVMAALGQAAAVAPDLEGAAAEIANAAEKITKDIIAKAKAVLAQHDDDTAGAASGKVVPMPFRPPVTVPELPVAVNGAPPPFIAPISMPAPLPATVALETVAKGMDELRGGVTNEAKEAHAPVAPPPFVPPAGPEMHCTAFAIDDAGHVSTSWAAGPAPIPQPFDLTTLLPRPKS